MRKNLDLRELNKALIFAFRAIAKNCCFFKIYKYYSVYTVVWLHLALSLS